jgi:hypothetical protein
LNSVTPPLVAKKTYADGFKKPDVPKKDEKPIMGLVSDKNYIVANAVENILAGKTASLTSQPPRCRPTRRRTT